MKIRSLLPVRVAMILTLLNLNICFAQSAGNKMVTVDVNGKGMFKSIQDAINSLPDSASTDRVILIKNGIYHEKLFITKNHIVLKGESEKRTVITQDIARDIWRCQNHADDWGVATLNMRGNDITLQNLSIINGYGFHHPADTVVNCQSGGQVTNKTVNAIGHQMALRTFQTTRLRVLNCTLRALGGDTVSPWNTFNGMFYFKNCTMEGGVDFYCPRGWAYAEDCKFVCHNKEAAIWHDGSGNPAQKTVLVNCQFNGDEGFRLGRYHKDAQFYLINCRFASNMANAPIYQAASSPGIRWGRRIYYANCHRQGGDYAWFQDNIQLVLTAPAVSKINAAWAFDGQWTPDK